MARTGSCFLCGSPSNPKGIGGELERCLDCMAKAARVRRKRWSEKNGDRELEMKKAWDAANLPRKRAAATAWRKANLARFNESGKAWKKRNPAAMRVYYLRKYGLTHETFAALLAKQNGACAICGLKMKRPCIDHDHETNAVRGLLCIGCNAALGGFKESTGNLLSAVDYLIEHGAPGILKVG